MSAAERRESANRDSSLALFMMVAQPTIILLAPQLGENIGMVARAMANCGLNDLRLVKPRDGWPNPAAYPTAAGADHILQRARVFATLEESVSDQHNVCAVSARKREVALPVLCAQEACVWLRTHAAQRNALLFGPEKDGLTNEDLTLANVQVRIPLSPGFRSLNLAQAVLLLGWLWFASCPERAQRPSEEGSRSAMPQERSPCTKQELSFFLQRLETNIAQTGFFHPPEKAPRMKRNLRTFFVRSKPSVQELRTLHGIVSALCKAQSCKK